MSLVHQYHKNLSAHICTDFKFCFVIEASTMLLKMVTLVKTIHILMVFGYIFRRDNLLYTSTSHDVNIRYSGLTQTDDEIKSLVIFPPCG